MQPQNLTELLSRLWHGADYNYEQWLEFPDVLHEDFRLMNLAHCTAMSVGIFSWAKLEPREGQYDFRWLDALMDDLHGHGIRAILATPSAAHPAWLSARVPEVQRMNHLGQREPHRGRQNFCRTSPVFREKVTAINTLLADRYKDHPALLLWHVSNEYGSTVCYCPTCLADFRRWLAARYGDLDGVNRAWWTTFWSHTYTDWDEIDPVDPSNNGLLLDWQRYNSDQVLDFYRMECAPLRQLTPHIPLTTNFMRPDVGLDYWKIAEHIDIVCWDSYPEWHVHDDVQTACETAFYHDLHRGYKQGQPFYLLESSPSQTNWQPLSRLKRPGMVKLASAQALAHGAMGVNYFQWRQSRGGEEKFHGAVVAHRGGENTRTFREVVEVGEMLAGMPALAAARTPARVGIIYDFENEWALGLAHLPRKVNKEYQATCIEHYTAFWRRGIPVDVINARQDFSKYALVIAPMLYLLSEETATRLTEFVRAGGTLVTTYMTGWVNESDLTHLGASPLEAVWGFKLVEYDTFGADQAGQVMCTAGNTLDLIGSARCGRFADLLEPTTAEVLAVYARDFYGTQAALTVNAYGQGKAYHLGTQVDEPFLGAFYEKLTRALGLFPLLTGLPHGVSAQARQTERQQFLFLMNFTNQTQTISVEETATDLPPYGVRIVVKDVEII
ncbi:MAG: beta-galactosidase [Anaerolineales bacterium]|nr:beta-galactosidase [Anaerolineales bacterium]